MDSAAGKVIVTCKKSLVSSDLPVITSFEDAEPGVQSHGYISSVKVCTLVPRVAHDQLG